MSFTWENLHRAMYILVGQGTQRERLYQAYVHNLACLQAQDIPAEMRSDFILLSRALADSTSGQGTRQLSDEEVNAFLNSIVRIYDVVTRYQPILPLRHSAEEHHAGAL